MYDSSITFQIPGLIQWMVMIFIFDCVTLQTSHIPKKDKFLQSRNRFFFSPETIPLFLSPSLVPSLFTPCSLFLLHCFPCYQPENLSISFFIFFIPLTGIRISYERTRKEIWWGFKGKKKCSITHVPVAITTWQISKAGAQRYMISMSWSC